ncbi:major capsid protein [Endozoicomonas gorgoniicola]|uniref:Major capsid protein n=1 Tax=Endozoicomonas gorgoniicola TaxID=1234144 RepID=A0ABT3MV91_9GAMM|nr:major capsid protein [Endozoicomonas gorgoniicola]MCW7553299.1 major capsid protein [Endozoicomonas gorgoniicola]
MFDIFSNDAFSLTSLTATINEMDYKPMRLGELGLFQESGIDVRGESVKVRRKVEKALGAEMYTGLRALCGADFFDSLVGHEKVEKAYERYQDGAMLRDDVRSGFQFGNIHWEEYRGSVEDKEFIAADEAYLYPEGTGIFRTWFAPADFVETVNTIGLPRYAKQKPLDFDKGIQIHTQSNPLPINLRPRAVIKLKMS